VQSAEEAQALVARAKAAVETAGGEAAYDLFYDEPADTPYEDYDAESASQFDGILVKQVDGSLTHIGAISPLPQALNQRLMFRRIHVSAAYRDAVAGVCR
jgi:HD superfamily phosphohydrolase